jgi:hypothetical protein
LREIYAGYYTVEENMSEQLTITHTEFDGPSRARQASSLRHPDSGGFRNSHEKADPAWVWFAHAVYQMTAEVYGKSVCGVRTLMFQGDIPFRALFWIMSSNEHMYDGTRALHPPQFVDPGK